MNGQMMNFNNYQVSLSKMVSLEPTRTPFEIDYKGLIAFAKEKGKKVVELTEKEKEKFYKVK